MDALGLFWHLVDFVLPALGMAAITAGLVKLMWRRRLAGLELEEIAQALDISLATTKRDWSLARAWLRRSLQADG